MTIDQVILKLKRHNQAKKHDFYFGSLKGMAQAKIIKKSVILFYLLFNMTI